MGNILRKLCGSENYDNTVGQHGAPLAYQAAPLGPHGVSVETVGFAALARDLFQFELTHEVPEGLDSYVQSSKAAQTKWYAKLHTAWKTANPPPSNTEEASQLVLQVLRGHRKADVEGFLSFYGLGPSPASAVAVPAPSVVVPAPAAVVPPQVAVAVGPWPKGVQYELHTLPVEGGSATDGDTLTVYVDASNEAREVAAVPLPVQDALARWRTARWQNDNKTADLVQKEIKKAGYKVVDSKDGSGTIARRYKVRLRGIDAPESSMPFGPEAKAMLGSLVEGQALRLLVYTVDRYGRIVADVFCNKGFVQEILLKNGACWHYIAYDKRPELSKWEDEARSRGLGLWGEPNAVKPWEYRRDKRK
ncbi:hypothetical protein GOP47_0006948 [Adiantum capillus-veneris]|uniref:TNase-like domain-containing protein n=1 Tax=Adiantum capillus-veneris TaxID=13818 RepID=A0A9D4ZIU9_ADICA|nr:hypothetical protein GOP47_0006948 [Adiantum capillus-veneris]